MPHLLDLQTKSYEWFCKEGLRDVFADISPIEDSAHKWALHFGEYYFKKEKYSIDECKTRDATYSAPLQVKVQLVNKETGEIKEHDLFMGDFPIMTDTGTFIINGAERVIVSQLVRSPGVYYKRKWTLSGRKSIPPSSFRTAARGSNWKPMPTALFPSVSTVTARCP